MSIEVVSHSVIIINLVFDSLVSCVQIVYCVGHCFQEVTSRCLQLLSRSLLSVLSD